MVSRKAVAEALPAWYSPALDAPNMSEKNLVATRLMMATQGSKMGESGLRHGSAEPEAKGSTFYPFFLSTLIAVLVHPFSDFFYVVLRRYRLQTLHLHPNSVILLSIFAYYCVGGKRHLWDHWNPYYGCGARGS